MSKAAYRAKPYTHPRLKWVVRTKVTGNWKRKFFQTKGEADTYVQQKETELLNSGIEGATFPTHLRVMAQREDARLRPFGKTIADAVDFYIQHLEATTKSVSLSQAMTEVIANRKGSGSSERYCADLRLRIGRFCAAHPRQTVAEINTAQIDSWLETLGVAPITRNTFRRDLRTLFSFCLTRRYCVSNPVAESRKAKEVPGEVQILTVTDAAKLISSAEPEMVPYFAISAFAGLRRKEVERLDWSEIDFDSGTIEVKAKNAKTAVRRLAKMSANLRAWLEPHAAAGGPVCPDRFREAFDQTRRKAGLLAPWPNNVLRHSFGSYHLARFNDAAALALEMGNSVPVIFKHYRNIVKPRQAELYWQIQPVCAKSRKVLTFRPAPKAA